MKITAYLDNFLKSGHIFKDDIASANPVHKVAICNEFGTKCANIFKEGTKSWFRISSR